MRAESKTDHILAVDLGGTKVAVALINGYGKILFRHEEPTSQQGPQLGMRQIVRLLQGLLNAAGISSQDVKGIGVGIPAVLNRENDLIIWAPNLNGWRNVALRPALEQELGIPTYIEYDGHTAVLGEWWQGAGRGYQSIATVVVGTGIGGGLILDGKLYRGFSRLAGAAGWFAMTSNATLGSSLGHALGHWESLAAGPGIVNRAQAQLPDYPASRLNIPDILTAKQIFEMARAGDPLAMECVNETANILGLGVANIVSLVNPEIVVLGGSIGQQGDLLVERIREVVMRWAQPVSAQSVIITTSTLGTGAGLYGAAYAVLTRTGSNGNSDLPEGERRKEAEGLDQRL